MELKQLARIIKGLPIDSKHLTATPPNKGHYVYLTPENFVQNTNINYVLTKYLQGISEPIGSFILTYGDYLLYKENNNFKLQRYENNNYSTLAGNGFVIIKSDLSIVQDFLSLKENRNYFFAELNRINTTNNDLPTPEQIGNINIPTDNINELVANNASEQIGLKVPIDIHKDRINIVQKPLTIDKILKRIEHNELLLNTEFQRRPGLWDPGTKSRLIESLIVKLPIPAFYFDGTNDDEWLVIDGLQRLSAIHSFIKGELILENLDFLPQLEGKKFSELLRPYQRNIEEYEIFAYIIQAGTPKSIAYRIFRNINSGALHLEAQEQRHALNPGIPAAFLKEIVETGWFQEHVPISNRLCERMYNREAALRFIAFKRTHYTAYKPPMNNFLDLAMEDLYSTTQSQRVSYKQELETVVTLLQRCLDGNAFARRLFDPNRIFNHNNIMFELLTYGVGLLNSDQRIQIFQHQKQQTKQQIISFFAQQSPRFWETEWANTQEGVKQRFEAIVNFIKQLSHD